MRLRIRKTPAEKDVDGVQLDGLAPGLVCEFSASVGSWLIAKGYAVPEMRSAERQIYGADQPRDFADDKRRTPRRRHDDR
jgi:hypothetical protein